MLQQMIQESISNMAVPASRVEAAPEMKGKDMKSNKGEFELFRGCGETKVTWENNPTLLANTAGDQIVLRGVISRDSDCCYNRTKNSFVTSEANLMDKKSKLIPYYWICRSGA